MTLDHDPRDADEMIDGYAPRKRVDSELQLRIPPQSVEAEQAVLGGLLLRNDALPRVSGWLASADFYRRDHQLIYQAILETAERNEPFDAVTLGEWFEAQGMGEQVAGGSYLVELASTTPSAANIEAYAEIVMEKSRLRQVIEHGTALVNDGFEPNGKRSAEIAMAANSALLDLTATSRRHGPKGAREISERWFQDMQRRYDTGGGIVGIPTPWSKLNRETMGFCGGDLVVVAGRPSMGKSAFAVNLFTSAVLSGKRALFFNLEMTDVSVFNRCIASVMEIPLRWLRSGGRDETLAGEDYWSKVTEGMRRFRDSGLLIDDQAGLTAAQIVARAKREHLRSPLSMVLIDHLHIVKLGKGEAHREIGDATTMFAGLAKALNCPVILLSQLNRGLEGRPNKRPQMQDLRESGAIEQDADVVLFIYRDDYYAEREQRDSEYPGWVEVSIAKQREGEAGQTVWLRNKLHIGLLDDHEGDSPTRAVAEQKQIQMQTRRSRGRGNSGADAATGEE